MREKPTVVCVKCSGPTIPDTYNKKAFWCEKCRKFTFIK